MSFFAEKVAIITGSSNGIGRGTAVLFAKHGARVTITGRNGATLQVIGDVTNESFCEKLVSETIAKFGRIDFLVNNAGGPTMANFGKDILDIPIDELDQMIDLNVRQVLRISQLAVPHLAKTKGAIVNVSQGQSTEHLSPLPYPLVAKTALDQVTIQMAGSLIKKGIRKQLANIFHLDIFSFSETVDIKNCDIFRPGGLNSNAIVTAGGTKEMQDQMMASLAAGPAIPLGRIGTPEDVAKVILFFSDRSQSEFLVGQIVTVDGGMSLKGAM